MIYVAGITKQVTPLIKDALAHLLWEHEHMVEVHYENGHYHVHVELKEQAKEDTKQEGHVPKTASEDHSSLHDMPVTPGCYLLSPSNSKVFIRADRHFASVSTDVATPPPDRMIA